ncbi:MAG TPA: hypothetical protein VGB24_20510 [Longimicrobium sp.]|jgi:hypothetical protein|uniref:hypothetical protein n=1 Tax=Longimicrobium sp. TaxID=2029185 RepID=UPI002EDB15FF
MGELKEIIDTGGQSLLRLIALACILVVTVTLGCVVFSDLDGTLAVVAALVVLVLFVAGGILTANGWLTRPGHPREREDIGAAADAEGTGRQV